MRIQIMHLPAPADQHDFAVVFDQCESEQVEALESASDRLKRLTGAKAVLCFETAVEVL